MTRPRHPSCRSRISLSSTLLVAAVLACAVCIPGCSGCFKAPNTAQQKDKDKKKKEEKPKPRFEIARLRVYPTDPDMRRANPAKPGHWLTAQQLVRSNHADFNAELEAAVVNKFGRAFPVEKTPYRMTVSRPAALPKAQTKLLETTYFVPRTLEGTRRKTAMLQCRIKSRNGRDEFRPDLQVTSRMHDYQYFFVVLSDKPDSYGYVKGLDPIVSEDNSFEKLLYYRVAAPVIDRFVPLSSHPLTWTGIAYILWDGLNPALLTPGQQGALLDWLHWGGQIIVSGPDSLDLLRSSFLAGYLPALSRETSPLSAEELAELNRDWSLRSQSGELQKIDVTPDRPLIGVELALQPEADFVSGTGQLVAERSIGNGRIVVTAFPLTANPIVQWGSLDSFFNAVLLRKPARQFRAIPADLTIATQYVDRNYPTTDARVATTLRFLSRDAGHANSGAFRSDDPHFCGYVPTADSGMAGWTDFSGTAVAARQTLTEAAGIKVPERKFVFRILAVYLLVLVPVNWGVFRVIGRVEWAWIAAPIIAIVAGVAVTRLAQLDIGFARSLTEIAVLEAQGGYSRGHLTRYTALYTSLGTRYDIAFDDATALSQPFANPKPGSGSPAAVKSVTLRRDQKVSLLGFHVPSNDTEMLHSEQMLDMGGSLSLKGDAGNLAVENGTDFAINEVGVIRKDESGRIEVAWIGNMTPGAIEPLEWSASSGRSPWVPQWDESEAMSKREDLETEEIRLKELVKLATEGVLLRPGDVRLIGWMDRPIPGMTVSPNTTQQTHRTIVVVHLRRGPLPEPRPDLNLLRDLVQQRDGRMEDEIDNLPEQPNP